jgi:hypothetical protein
MSDVTVHPHAGGHLVDTAGRAQDVLAQPLRLRRPLTPSMAAEHPARRFAV